MKQKKYFIDGCFGNKKIFIDLRVNKKSDWLVIFLHGAYGSVYKDKETKYQFLAKKLVKDCSIGFYQTSRFFEWKEKPELSFEAFKRQGFKGKTFKQELKDVKKSFWEIVSQVKKEIGNKKIKICLVGFSMGGIMSILLTEKVKDINKIMTLGTGMSFRISKNRKKEWSLVRTMLNRLELKRKLGNYFGNLTVILGEKDKLVDIKEGKSFFASAKKAQIRNLIIVKGADHRFNMINNKEAKEELNNYILDMIRFNCKNNIKP